MTLADIDFTSLEKQINDPLIRAVIGLLRQANEAHVKQNEAHVKQNEALLARIAELTAQITALNRMLFGHSSEKMPSMASEVRRALDGEEIADLLAREAQKKGAPLDDAEKRTVSRRLSRAKSEVTRREKRGIRTGLPVIIEEVKVTSEQLPEGLRIEDCREIEGGVIVERLEHVEEHLVCVQYHLQKVVTPGGGSIVTAAAPANVIEGGQYGPGVYADVVVSKCADSLPFYRIEKRYGRNGCAINRSTLCELFHRAAAILVPVYAALVREAKNSEILNADETTIPVQKDGGCKDGWIWTIITKTIIVYHFSVSRGGAVAKQLLEGTTGMLQVDGYSAYNAVCTETGRIRIGCWAHTRRMFFRALKNFPQAKEVLDWIIVLYVIERRAKQQGILGTDAHLKMRQKQSAPIIEKIRTWLNEQQPLHPPKSQLGKAITYAVNQWDSLNVFCTDPRVELDNNVSERALRIIALGRKNWLFVGKDGGGESMAVLQTIVATCILNNVNPYDYIKDVLIRLQSTDTKDLTPLMPANWTPPR
jgi:transposase